jgi:hypothetical protein
MTFDVTMAAGSAHAHDVGFQALTMPNGSGAPVGLGLAAKNRNLLSVSGAAVRHAGGASPRKRTGHGRED